MIKPPPVLNQTKKVIKRKIIDAADNIRKKYLSLKLERSETDEAINKFLTPIRTPLTKIAENTSNIIKAEKIKNEVKQEEEEEEETGDKKLFPKTAAFLPTKVVAESAIDNLKSDSDSDEDEVFNKHATQHESDLQKSISEKSGSYREYLEQYPKLVQKYIDLYYNDPNKIDQTYGLNYDKQTDNWKMGSEIIKFLPNGDLKVADGTYRGTRGLYDLLFLKEPMYPTRGDESQYQDILKRTNAHRRGHSQLGQIKGSNSIKYKQFIQPITAIKSTNVTASTSSSPKSRLPSSIARNKSGTSLLEYNEKAKEYVFYDDINELVERLIKLDASQSVGNGNHHNEITNILHELQELGIIEFYK